MKRDVTDWETVGTYVYTFPSDGGDDACDVSVQVGTDGAMWYVRTADDAGGSDDYSDAPYSTRDAATEAAIVFATDADEGEGYDAAGLVEAREAEDAAEDPSGDWAVWWETVCEDAGLVSRHPTERAATAAAAIANRRLAEGNPGGNLLCGYGIRREVFYGEWLPVVEDEI